MSILSLQIGGFSSYGPIDDQRTVRVIPPSSNFVLLHPLDTFLMSAPVPPYCQFTGVLVPFGTSKAFPMPGHLHAVLVRASLVESSELPPKRVRGLRLERAS